MTYSDAFTSDLRWAVLVLCAMALLTLTILLVRIALDDRRDRREFHHIDRRSHR